MIYGAKVRMYPVPYWISVSHGWDDPTAAAHVAVQYVEENLSPDAAGPEQSDGYDLALLVFRPDGSEREPTLHERAYFALGLEECGVERHTQHEDEQ